MKEKQGKTKNDKKMNKNLANFKIKNFSRI
jgi:hypothetical protein